MRFLHPEATVTRLKPTGKRRKKPARLTMQKQSEIARRRNGFNEFEVTKEMPIRGGKIVKVAEVAAPETGIHSLTWSTSITPQPTSSFLSLPWEIRCRIYTHCLTAWLDERGMYTPLLEPSKYLKKFVNRAYETHPTIGLSMSQISLNLGLVSRQTYVDVIGGSLLYTAATFVFTSPQMMYTYLSCINPAHVSRIRSILLFITIDSKNQKPAGKIFRTLGSMRTLQHLELELSDSSRSDPAAILKRIQNMKHWSEISGLRSFSLKFRDQGAWWPVRPTFTYSGGRNDDVVPIEEEIKKVVMRRL